MKRIVFIVILILVLLFVFLFWGGKQLNNYSINETIDELKTNKVSTISDIDFAEISNNPNPLKKYFQKVISTNSKNYNFVTLNQKAEFKTNTESEWLPLTAKEFIDPHQVKYFWKAEIQTSSLFWVDLMDSYLNGKGNILVKLNSSITITDSWGTEIDKSALVKFISEAVLYPISLLPSDSLSWNVIDSSSAEINFKQNNQAIVGKFYFNKDGTINKFETSDKYKASEGGLSKGVFTVLYNDYKNFDNGLLVPSKYEMEWMLPNGNFKFGKFEVLEIEYNSK